MCLGKNIPGVVGARLSLIHIIRDRTLVALRAAMDSRGRFSAMLRISSVGRSVTLRAGSSRYVMCRL